MPARHIATELVEPIHIFFSIYILIIIYIFFRFSVKMTEKRYNLSDPNDLNQVMSLLLDEEDPLLVEDLGHESDIASQDEVEERQDSCTEQEGDSGSEEDDSGGEIENSYLLGKDKLTKWSLRKPNIVRRRGPENIITRLPGVIGEARQAKTAEECWNNFFSEEIIEVVVTYTNQYITDHVKDKFARERDIQLTDVIELRAFLGLLYLAGAYRANRQSLEELWGRENDGIEKLSLVMSLRRFKTLLRCLRFDNRSTRPERKQYDRLFPIRNILDVFVRNCQNCYCVGENVTIDEMLPGFRGRCPFRQYIPSKPTKYGIKCFALVDAKMMYTYNLEVYAGKQPEGPFQVSNKPCDVVKRIAEPLFGSGRNITADNWFTDFELLDFLKSKKLTYVGTVRKNKRQLPPEFLNVRWREQYDSKFGYNDGKTLVSYIPRLRKNVILVSTFHCDDAIDESSGEQKKPKIITFYNSTKVGVDVADQMCATYNVCRNTKRWPMIIFFTMMNIAGINSHVVHIGNGLEPLRRRLFLKQLAHELTVPEIKRRSLKLQGIPTSLQERLKRYRPINENNENTPSSSSPAKRRRCETCTEETGTRRLSKYSCFSCKRSICLTHANYMCRDCQGRETTLEESHNTEDEVF